ncbi:hypothetical protein M3Y99_01926800 [Aphelenchoides fujianensis]|nr:hypothetical protein M3Y99_01926800 [Aphelenchoides fujianensis]
MNLQPASAQRNGGNSPHEQPDEHDEEDSLARGMRQMDALCHKVQMIASLPFRAVFGEPGADDRSNANRPRRSQRTASSPPPVFAERPPAGQRGAAQRREAEDRRDFRATSIPSDPAINPTANGRAPATPTGGRRRANEDAGGGERRRLPAGRSARLDGRPPGSTRENRREHRGEHERSRESSSRYERESQRSFDRERERRREERRAELEVEREREGVPHGARFFRDAVAQLVLPVASFPSLPPARWYSERLLELPLPRRASRAPSSALYTHREEDDDLRRRLRRVNESINRSAAEAELHQQWADSMTLPPGEFGGHWPQFDFNGAALPRVHGGAVRRRAAPQLPRRLRPLRSLDREWARRPPRSRRARSGVPAGSSSFRHEASGSKKAAASAPSAEFQRLQLAGRRFPVLERPIAAILQLGSGRNLAFEMHEVLDRRIKATECTWMKRMRDRCSIPKTQRDDVENEIADLQAEQKDMENFYKHL